MEGSASIWKGVYWSSLANYVKNITKKTRPEYLGHNPIARLIVSIFFALLILEGITGLILAGTDLYMPPLGHEVAEWVTGSGEDHSKLEGSKTWFKRECRS